MPATAARHVLISSFTHLMMMNRRAPACCIFHWNMSVHVHALSQLSSFSRIHGAIREKRLGLLYEKNSIIEQQQPLQPVIAGLHAYQALSTSTSFDPNEIRRFESIASSSDWLDERYGPFRPLHTFNRIRIPWVLSHMSKFSSPADSDKRPLGSKRILDVGCGAGILSLSLCRLGAMVTGLDAGQPIIELAKKYSETLAPDIRTNANFLCGTIEELSEKHDVDKKFDAIVASEVIEHVSDLPLFVRSCCKLARPNAPLFFTTINRTILSQLAAKTLAEDVFRILPKGLHDFDKFVKPNELRKLLLDEQCSVGPVLGLAYNPLLNKWSWTSCTEVNYAIVAYTRKEA